MAWLGLTLAWPGLAWLGVAWLGLALALAWLGLAWLGLAWLGVAWLGFGLAWQKYRFAGSFFQLFVMHLNLKTEQKYFKH